MAKQWYERIFEFGFLWRLRKMLQAFARKNFPDNEGNWPKSYPRPKPLGTPFPPSSDGFKPAKPITPAEPEKPVEPVKPPPTPKPEVPKTKEGKRNFSKSAVKRQRNR